MKKFYTLLLGAAVAVSATAAAPVAQKAFNKEVKPLEAINLTAPAAKAPAAKAPAKAIANIDEIYGSYKVYGYDPLEEDEVVSANHVMTISAGSKDGEVFMKSIFPGLNMTGTVDLAKGTISVPYHNFGANSQGYDVVWAPVLVDMTTGLISLGTGDVVFNVTETGLEIDNQLRIMALSAVRNGNLAGFFEVCYATEITKFNPDEQWEDAGVTVTYTDDLFFPLLLKEDDDYASDPMYWSVTLQKSKDDPNAFALLDPYKPLIDALVAEGLEGASYDDSMSHRMVFHIDGSNLVWFEDFESGILMNLDGTNAEIIFYTQVGELCAQNGPFGVYNRYPDGFGKFSENTVTYPMLMTGTNAEGQTQQFYNWLVEWDGDIINGGNMNGLLKIAGVPTPAAVEDIAVDTEDENAPVEYFNLQGQRVAEPANGLYIRRQGKTVSKVVL